MNYKDVSSMTAFSNNAGSVFGQLQEADHSKEPTIKQKSDIMLYEPIFQQIKTFFLNNVNEMVIESIEKLNLSEISNDSNIYTFFETNNIALILATYLDPNFGFRFNRSALMAIIDFSRFDNEKYLEKFLEQQLIEKLSPLTTNHYFVPFVIMELSIISRRKNNLEFFFSYINNLSNFFEVVLKSHGINIKPLMETFSNIISIIFQNNISNQFLLEIFTGIENLIDNLRLEFISDCVELFHFIANFSESPEFEFYAENTKIIQKLISLMKRYNPLDDQHFYITILAIISVFSQKYALIIEEEIFFLKQIECYNNSVISIPLIYIIGNICELSKSVSSDLFHSNFLIILMEIICSGRNNSKIEALTCFSKIIIFSSSQQRRELFERLHKVNEVSYQPYFNILEDLVDSINLLVFDDSEHIRIHSIITIIDDLQKEIGNEELGKVLDSVEINRILEVEFNETSSTESIEAVGILRTTINSLFQQETTEQ